LLSVNDSSKNIDLGKTNSKVEPLEVMQNFIRFILLQKNIIK
jgi:hypothetical protein